MKQSGTASYEEEDEEKGAEKKSNGLPIWGNEKTMNLNSLILTNIQSSQYFKVNLYQLKTYHEVIDEIYYNVNHLEPWEKGSRKTSGQTGMCGGVRGVGAGGIVSTAFCILYKLYTLRLSRKQVNGLINHGDSPYIRGLGFMYIRYTQPPADLWDWFEAYLEDEEEIEVRAGGGPAQTVGQVVRHMMTKLDWYCTLFPRIPVPIQKNIEKNLNQREASTPMAASAIPPGSARAPAGAVRYAAENDRNERSASGGFDDRKDRGGSKDLREDRKDFREDRKDFKDTHDHRDTDRHRERNGDVDRDHRDRKDKDRERHKERDRERRHKDHKDRHRERRRSRSRSREHKHRHRSDHHHHRRSRSRDRSSRDRSSRDRSNRSDFAADLEREKARVRKLQKGESREKERHRDKSPGKHRH